MLGFSWNIPLNADAKLHSRILALALRMTQLPGEMLPHLLEGTLRAGLQNGTVAVVKWQSHLVTRTKTDDASRSAPPRKFRVSGFFSSLPSRK